MQQLPHAMTKYLHPLAMTAACFEEYVMLRQGYLDSFTQFALFIDFANNPEYFALLRFEYAFVGSLHER